MFSLLRLRWLICSRASLICNKREQSYFLRYPEFVQLQLKSFTVVNVKIKDGEGTSTAIAQLEEEKVVVGV